LGAIPDRIVRLVGPFDLFIGADPVFAGLHPHETTVDGRSYRHTPHALYPVHLRHLGAAFAAPRIVLPAEYPWPFPVVVIHEFGHVLDWRLRFDWSAEVTSVYSRTNRHEAFAEAFVSWMWDEPIAARDKAFLEGLAV